MTVLTLVKGLLGNDIFMQAAGVYHFNDHVNGMENDHISALTRCVIGTAVRIKIMQNGTPL